MKLNEGVKSPYAHEVGAVIALHHIRERCAEVIERCHALKEDASVMLDLFGKHENGDDTSWQEYASTFDFSNKSMFDFIESLKYPVSSGLFLTANEALRQSGDPELDWSQIRRFQGLPVDNENESELYFQFIRDVHMAFMYRPRENFEQYEKMLDSLIEIMANRIEALGGDSDKQVAKVCEGYVVSDDSSWHDVYLGDFENKVLAYMFALVCEEFFMASEDMNLGELGIGDGRIIKVLRSLSGKEINGFKVGNLEDVIDNFQGIELVASNVEEVKRKILDFSRSRGLNAEALEEVLNGHLHRGNLFDASAGKIIEALHGLLCDMRTVLYADTDNKLTTFLRVAESALLPGGYLAFDSVDILPLNDLPQEVISVLGDLNLYHIFRKRACQEGKVLMAQGYDMERIHDPQHRDNTTGIGEYKRRVLTEEKLRYILEKNKIGLELRAIVKRTLHYSDANEMNEKTIELGLKWMRDNDIEGHIKQVIEERLRLKIIDPRILERAGCSDFNMNEGIKLEKLTRFVAFNLVYRFPAIFFILQKTNLNKKTAAKDIERLSFDDTGA